MTQPGIPMPGLPMAQPAQQQQAAPGQGVDFGRLMQQMGQQLEDLPNGPYDVVVKDAQPASTQNNKPMLKVKFAVESGPHAGRIIWNNFTISEESQPALLIFFTQMRNMGLGPEFFAARPSMDQVAQSLIGKRARVVIQQRNWQGTNRPNVTRVDPAIGGAFAAPASGTPMPGGAPQPIAAAPIAPVTPAPAPVAPPAVAPAPQPDPWSAPPLQEGQPQPSQQPQPQPQSMQPQVVTVPNFDPSQFQYVQPQQPQQPVPSPQPSGTEQVQQPAPAPVAPAPAPPAPAPAPSAPSEAAQQAPAFVPPAPAPQPDQNVAQAAPAPAPQPQPQFQQPPAPAGGALPPAVPF